MRQLAALLVLILSVRVFAGDIIVDQNHPLADDRNAGTAESPLKTISAAATRTLPGDRVIIKAGIYHETVRVRTSGTKARPIQYIADTPGKTIIDGGFPRKQFTRLVGNEPIYRTLWSQTFIITRHGDVSIQHHPDDLPVHGRADLVLCDGVPLLQVANLDELRETYVKTNGKAQPAVPGLGKFAGMVWINTRRGSAYFWLNDGEDPEKHDVQIADKHRLFGCEPGELPDGVQNIHVKGMIFRHASNFAQRPAVWLYGSDNLLEDCVIETMSGQGVAVSGTMRRCVIRNCGAIGGSATGSDFLNEACLWEDNCWKPYDRGWEAGGTKIALAKNGAFKDCVFRHNGGPGLWLDIDTRNVQIDNCVFVNNEQSGLFIEISRDVHVSRSLFEGNGLGTIGEKRDSDWGIAGVTIGESQNCSIRNCTIINNRDGIATREQGPRTLNTEQNGEVTYFNVGHQFSANYVANNRGFQLAFWYDNAFFGPHPSEANLYPTDTLWDKHLKSMGNLVFDPLKQKIDVHGNIFAASARQKMFLMGAPWRNRSKELDALSDMGDNEIQKNTGNFDPPDDVGWVDAPRDLEAHIKRLRLPAAP
jgi:hypothetical protein